MTAELATFKIFLLRHGQSELNHENIFCGWIDAKLTEKGKSQAQHSAALIKDYCEQNKVPLPEIGFTSRLVRTQQTMRVLLQELGLKGTSSIMSGNPDALSNIKMENLRKDQGTIPVLQTWRLNERHYGSWQGKRKPEILKEYGDDQYMYIRRDYNGKPPKVDLKLEMIQETNEQGSSTGYDFKEPNRHLKYGDEEANNEKLPAGESLADVEKRIKPFLNDVVLRLGKENELSSCLIVGHGSSVRSLLKIIENISDEDIKGIDIPNGIPLVVELDRHTSTLVRSFYLDPESAKINAEKVRKEGFENNP